MGTDDKETVIQAPTQFQRKINTPEMPATNSNTQGVRIHNYWRKNDNFIVNLVESNVLEKHHS